MASTLVSQLTEAFRSGDPQAASGLLGRAAKHAADLMAAADAGATREFCEGLDRIFGQAQQLELSPELAELHAHLGALVQLTRAALQRTEGHDAPTTAPETDHRPAILAAIRGQGAAPHDQLAATLGIAAEPLARAIRSLVDSKTITAMEIDGAPSYALTPLGFVVARRLEERAGAQPHEAAPPAPTAAPTPEPVAPPPGALSLETEEVPAVGPPEEETKEDTGEDLELALDALEAKAPEPSAAAEPPTQPPGAPPTSTDDLAAIELDEQAAEPPLEEPPTEESGELEAAPPPPQEATPPVEPPPAPPAEEAPAARRESKKTRLARARRWEHRKTRVALLHGGITGERDVSAAMGDAVADALRDAGYQVETTDVREAALSEVTPRLIDVAFVALRGSFGEDGGVQAMLDALGVPYTGSSAEASRLAIDKIAAKKRFRKAAVPTPAFVELEAEWGEPLKLRAARSLGFPVVLKPTSEGSSLGVALARNDDELPEALARPFTFDTRALVEQFIDGREFTIGILDDYPLSTIELLYEGPILTYELRQAPGAVECVAHPDLSPELAEKIQSAALAAHRSLGCGGCTRVDIRLGPDGVPTVLEVNTVPPLTPDSLLAASARAAGIDFATLCEQIVEVALAPQGQT